MQVDGDEREERNDMAVLDTHKAVKTLTGAGFPESQAEALIETIGEARDELATKGDIHLLQQDVHVLLQEVNERATKSDLHALGQANKADLRELELRMRLHLGAYVFAAAGLVIAVMLALELLPR